MTDIKRSYTNSDGMTIEVSKDHLDAAVEIKLQLQEASPSRRCSWHKHRKMMQQEGFEDSDVNESYRCLIKNYQKEIGKLAPVYKYADYVADGKLNAIKKTLGDMYMANEESKDIHRELRKIKKDLRLTVQAVEEIRSIFLDDIEFNIPHYAYQPRLVSSQNEMLVNVSDTHTGLKTSIWDYSILEKQLEHYKNEIIDYAKLFKINQIYVAGLGDFIEGAYNRGQSQAFNIEFNVSEQINKIIKLFIKFLVNLSEYLNVEYVGTLFGNHDRLQGNKQYNIDGDSAANIIHHSVINFIDMSNIERLTYDKETLISDFEMSKEINGKLIKFVHGDNESRSDGNKIKKHISLDGKLYDMLILGHLHHYEVFEENDGRLEMYLGCFPKGGDYPRKLKLNSKPSQGIVIFTEKDIIPIRVDLDVS